MKSRKEDIFPGSDAYELVDLDGILEENNMQLRNTIFGWIVSGSINEIKSTVNSITILSTKFDLKKLWELEEVNTAQK